MTAESNQFVELLVKLFNHIDSNKTTSFLDRNNIIWKLINNEWIGKRSVWTLDNRACWLEETTKDNIKSWWCGTDADYTEIFKRNDN